MGLKKTLPQAAHIFRQDHIIQISGNLIQVQGANIFCPAMRQHLLDVPAALEGIGQIHLICTPNNISWRMYGAHSLIINAFVWSKSAIPVSNLSFLIQNQLQSALYFLPSQYFLPENQKAARIRQLKRITANRPSAELVVAVASAAWGLFWIPLRAFQNQGLEPAWATLAQFLAPLLALLPLALYRWRRGLPSGVGQYRTGILVGTAVALYLESLLLTQVARALILFYAMPAWGTILEVGLLRRPFTRWRGIALALSLAGLFVILGQGGGSMAAINVGDLMALLSGIIFAFGALRVRQEPERSVFEQVFAFFLYGFAAAAALALLPLAVLGEPPGRAELASLAPWLMLVAVGYLIPVMAGIYWGSRQIDPGRLGILLQIEAVVGIASAALFSGEPFDSRLALGAALVIGAAVVEVVGNRQAAAAVSQDSQAGG